MSFSIRRLFLPCLALTLFVVGAVAPAHEGVMNPAVMARMEAMKSANDAVRTLGGMARGRIAFDAAAAAAARTDLIAALEQTPALFEAPETDPMTEARPEIWQDWPRYLALSEASVTAARALSTASLADVQAGLGRIGATCSACHEDYRIEN